MSDYHMISWQAGDARVAAFSTSMRGGKTVVKVEIEVSTPYALGDIVRQLQEASATPRARAKPKFKL